MRGVVACAWPRVRDDTWRGAPRPQERAVERAGERAGAAEAELAARTQNFERALAAREGQVARKPREVPVPLVGGAALQLSLVAATLAGGPAWPWLGEGWPSNGKHLFF